MGNRIKVIRKNKGITQKELAEKLCVTPQAVSQFEKSRSDKFNFATLRNIAEALECSIQDLVDVDSIMPKISLDAVPKDDYRDSRLTMYLMMEASKLNRMGHDALSNYLDLLLSTEKYTSENADVLKEAWGEEMYEKFYPKDDQKDFEVETGIYHFPFDAGNEV